MLLPNLPLEMEVNHNNSKNMTVTLGFCRDLMSQAAFRN